MSGRRLSEELHRLADAAPVARVPDDLWDRARRRRTGSIAVAATVAACLAVLVALLGARIAPDRGTVPADTRSEPRMPSRVWGVPERMTARENDGTWLRDQVSDDLAIGPAAAAYLANGLPVVVGAEDGRYHLLDLPDFLGNNRMSSIGLYGNRLGFALSPDGTRLAYGYAHFGPDAATEPIPSGIKVVDLVDGSVRTIPLRGDEGVFVAGLRWSPSGTWLGWAGYRMGSWTAEGMGGSSPPAAGLVAPGTSTSIPLPPLDVEDSQSDLAVDDDGAVALALPNRLVRTGPAGASPRRQRAGWVGAPVSLRRYAGRTYGLIGDLSGDPARLSVDGEDRGALGALGGAALLLAVLDDDRLVALTDPEASPQRVVTLRDGRPTEPVVVEPGLQQLSLATDLLAAAPPVARPEPRWPWSEERWAAVIGLALAVVLGAVAVGRRTARRLSVRRGMQPNRRFPGGTPHGE